MISLGMFRLAFLHHHVPTGRVLSGRVPSFRVMSRHVPSNRVPSSRFFLHKVYLLQICDMFFQQGSLEL
jgi:hypothetical protein